MDLHRVHRVGWVLVASELRSGRSLSNPRSLIGRPWILLVVDAAVFAGIFGLVSLVARRLGAANLAASSGVIGVPLLALLPVLAVAVVLVAGVMFEFSTSSRFAVSDAVNWLPVTPTEYVLGSALAVSLIYSTAAAFLLGAALAIALSLGLLPTFGIAAAFALLGLFEGGLLIEMLRATLQRAGTALSGRTGKVTLVLRAVLFLLVILAFQVVFNPVILVGVLSTVTGVTTWAGLVPLFWSTEAVGLFAQGAWPLAALFAVGQLGFVVLLAYLATVLRVRFWSPSAAEVRLEAHEYGGRHPFLQGIGLASPEASIVSKDLVGLVRRREMLPTLVTPMVLAFLGFVQSGISGGGGEPTLTLALWVIWVPGFFALMLAITSFGQERRAVGSLFAFPLSARNLFRAKAAPSLLLPALLAVVLGGFVGVLAGIPPGALAGLGLLAALAIALASMVGLTVATRYSDFQERPRSQFVRPWAMVAGMLGGISLVFAVALPGVVWLLGPEPASGPALAAGLFAIGIGAVGIAGFLRLARQGSDRFLEELRS